MAKAKKLPSGSWRVNQYVGKDKNGKRIYKSFTASSKKEAEFMAAEYVLLYKDKNSANHINLTLGDAIDMYIDSKINVLSPGTVRGYRSIRNNRLRLIIDRKLSDLTPLLIQEAISEDAKDHAPKTVQNVHGLLSAVLKMFAPKLDPSATLPQKKPYEFYIPTEEEVSLLFFNTSNRVLRTAIILAACLGLRRSEICALTWDKVNFDLNVIKIDSAIVQNEHGEWVLKPIPKTNAGYRLIPIPSVVLSYLEELRKINAPICGITPSALSDRFFDQLDKLDIPHFRLHDLRHFNASIMLALGIPDKYAMELMGHATPHMLKTVYQHTLKNKRQEVIESLDNFYSQNMKKPPTNYTP